MQKDTQLLRDIFRAPNLLKTRFQKKIILYMRSISYLLFFSQIAKISAFFPKTQLF